MSPNNQPMPQAPDYTNLARQQTLLNQQYGRPNEVTPFGSRTWNTLPGGQQQLTTSFSPNQQAIQTEKEKAVLGLGRIGSNLMDQTASNLSKPLDTSTAPALNSTIGTGDFGTQLQSASDSVYNQAKRQLDPQWQEADTALRTQLVNAGIPQNSEAWDKAVASHERNKEYAYSQARDRAISQGNALQQQLFNQDYTRSQFGNQARSQALNEAMTLRGLPLSELASVYRTVPDSNPTTGQFGGFTGMAGPDIAGAAGQQYQADLNAYNQRTAQDAQASNDWMKLGTTVGGSLLSDYLKNGDTSLISRGYDKVKGFFDPSAVTTAGAELGAGTGGAFDAWAADTPGIDTNAFGGYDPSGTQQVSGLPADYWTRTADSGQIMSDASSAQTTQAIDAVQNDPGFMSYLQRAGNVAGNVSALNTIAKIARGEEVNPAEAGIAMQSLISAYSTYAAATAAGASTGAALGAAATGAATGATGAAAGAAAGGGIALGPLAAVFAYGAAQEGHEQKAMVEGGGRTNERLQSIITDPNDFDPAKMFSIVDSSQDAADKSRLFGIHYGAEGPPSGTPVLSPNNAYWDYLRAKYPRINSEIGMQDIYGDYTNLMANTAVGQQLMAQYQQRMQQQAAERERQAAAARAANPALQQSYEQQQWQNAYNDSLNNSGGG